MLSDSRIIITWRGSKRSRGWEKARCVVVKSTNSGAKMQQFKRWLCPSVEIWACLHCSNFRPVAFLCQMGSWSYLPGKVVRWMKWVNLWKHKRLLGTPWARQHFPGDLLSGLAGTHSLCGNCGEDPPMRLHPPDPAALDWGSGRSRRISVGFSTCSVPPPGRCAETWLCLIRAPYRLSETPTRLKQR